MKVLANLGKTNDGHDALVIMDGATMKFVVCRYYDPTAPENQQWSWGHYYHDVNSFSKAVVEEFSGE